MKISVPDSSENIVSTPEASSCDEKVAYVAPKLVRLDVQETQGTVAGNADPFVS